MTIPTTIPGSDTSPPCEEEKVPDSGRVAGLDIRNVISGSTSDVPVSELSRKGFKHVKVVNQALIGRLITEAVDRVISERARKIGREERERVIQESRSQFEVLARERLREERARIDALEEENGSLRGETEDLKRRLREREEEVERLKASAGQLQLAPDKIAEALLARLPAAAPASAPGTDLEALRRSIEAMAAKLDRLPAAKGAVAGSNDETDLIEALFRLDGGEAADSNFGKVKVKETKAGGVKDTLAKLKALQKGGKNGD